MVAKKNKKIKKNPKKIKQIKKIIKKHGVQIFEYSLVSLGVYSGTSLHCCAQPYPTIYACVHVQYNCFERVNATVHMKT